MKVFEELKKRNVYKVAVAYLVTSWLIIQVVNTIGPNLGWPSAIASFITKILLVGFPIAIVFAWLYELTPRGFRRTGAIQEGTINNAKAGRRLNRFIIGALAIALCFMLVERVFFAGNHHTQDKEASIAVLPFNYLSSVDSLAFMSEALSGAIGHKLGRVNGLRVIGKISSSQFKDFSGDIKEIGKKLNVSYIIEGDLRLERNRIRLFTRLIDASDGRVQWQKQYDQDFQTIMALEDDISNNVVRELRVEVFPDEYLRIRKPLTQNSEAYKLFLEGTEIGQKRNQESLTEAITLIEEAIVLEPAFARAHAELVILYTLQHIYGELSREMMLNKAQMHLERARDIDPYLPETQFAIARVEGFINRDSTNNIFHLREAIRLNSNYAPAHYALSNVLSRMGFDYSAIQSLQIAASLDPYNDLYAARLAAAYNTSLNEPEKAMAILNRILEINPKARACSNQKANLIANAPYGDLAEAFKIIHRTRENDQYEAVQLHRLIDYCIELDLAPLAKRYMKLLQWRYPSNNVINISAQMRLNLFTNRFRDNIDLLTLTHANNSFPQEWEPEKAVPELLAASHISINEHEKAEELLNLSYPELASALAANTLENIDVSDNSNFIVLQHYIEIYRAKQNLRTSGMILDKLYSTRGEREENYYFLYPLLYYKGEVDSLVHMMDSIWFKQKNRGAFNLIRDYRGGNFRHLDDNPSFTRFMEDALKETHRMRAEVIDYLKEEGDWDPAWDNELGL